MGLPHRGGHLTENPDVGRGEIVRMQQCTQMRFDRTVQNHPERGVWRQFFKRQFDCVKNTLHADVEHFTDDLVLGLEVVVQTACLHVAGGSNGAQRRGSVALVAKQAGSRLQNHLP